MIPQKIVRAFLSVAVLALALGGCGDGDIPSFNQSTTTITGTVIAPAGDSQQFVAVASGSVLTRIAAFVLGDVHADITGLAPVAGATVELVRLSDNVVIDTAVTNENGVYTFTGAPATGPSSEYVVRVTGESDVMRAIVTGSVVDISPATEVVTGAVLDSLGGSVVLANYLVQEVAALYSLLIAMDIDVTGLGFGDAVEAIRDAAGPIFDEMLAAFSTPGTENVLQAGDYSVVEYSGALRDSFIVPVEGMPGGVEIDSGQGPMIFGNRAQPSPGFVAIGKFLHDFAAVAPLYPNDEPVEDGYPYLVGLNQLAHVVNDKRQLVVADVQNPSASIAGIGATTESGGLLIYPLDYGVRVDDAPSISGMGIRYAARWRLAGFGQTLPDLTLLDPAGGGPTVYHDIRLRQTLTAEEGGDNAVILTSSTGTASFDSTPQLHDFDGERNYGEVVSDVVTNSLQLDLSDYSISTAAGSDLNTSLFTMQNTGLMELRSETGTMLGVGLTSTDGERDGEVVGINTFSGGFDEPVTSTERTFSIAIRQASEMANADVAGNYNLVEYSGYLSEDAGATPPRAYVHTGIRYGTVTLNGSGAITAGTLFRKLARLDVAAARGETGAEPNLSGESGAFMTATAGAAGETFALIVDGITVYTFTSAAGGDTVEAADVQGGVDSALGDLSAVGIEVSGTVADGDLVFTKASGEAFDIEVVNEFTATASAAGGFEGDDFQPGSRIIDNATDPIPTESDPSGVFTTATAGETDEVFSFTVEGIEIINHEANAPGDTVTAAMIQSGLNDATSALSDIGISYSGSVAGSDLVFTRADGTDFTIEVNNGFTGIDGEIGGFAGADYATGSREINNGGEAVEAVATDSGPSGAFTVATAGAAGEVFTFSVEGVDIIERTSTAAGDTVTAEEIDTALGSVAGALTAIGITYTGTVAGGDLTFLRADGTDFTIDVNNGYSGIVGQIGGFAGDDYATGSRTIDEGIEGAPSTTDLTGAFATARSTVAGQEYTFSVGGTEVFTFTSDGAGDEVTAAQVQAGLDAVTATLVGEGFTIEGSVIGGDLVISRDDGAAFNITVVNTFTDDTIPAGGFASANFNGTTLIDNGTVASDATSNSTGSSGPFSTARATVAGQEYTLSVDAITVFTTGTSTAVGVEVTATDVQAGLDAVAGDLAAAGFTLTGSVTGGDLVISREDGAAFNITVVNTFTNDVIPAGGFAGAQFSGGAQLIDNGTELGDNSSAPSGDFVTANAGAADETFSLTVDAITVFTFTSTEAGDFVTAEDVQAGVDAAAGDLTTAGFTVSGTVAAGTLVFSRDDGAPFEITVVNEFSGTVSIAGGFAGDDFATGIQTVDNGRLAGPAPSLSSQSGQQTLSSGSYDVLANGQVTLILTIGDETITAQGAVTQNGEFIAVATGTSNGDNSRQGRGILFLIRQPD